MSLFDDCVGELMQILRLLADFYLIRLKPNSGLFFKGFGKAYENQVPGWVIYRI